MVKTRTFGPSQTNLCGREDKANYGTLTLRFFRNVPGEMEQSGNDELSITRLRISIVALSICHFITFIDQLGVSTALPATAAGLSTGTSTSWIGASFLVATTVLQLLHGPVSDTMGRKNLLAFCLFLLGVGDLACGLAQTRQQFFAFRGIAGLGAGGVSSLSMVVVLDITTQYQGIIGTVVTLSNALGPVLGGVIVQTTSWRWLFWIISIITIPTALTVLLLVPSKRRPGRASEKAKHIDYVGMAINLAATLLFLVPFAGAGVDYPWSSPRFVAPLPIGAVLGVVFLLFEWKCPQVPAIQLRLFWAPHCWALYAQAFLTGSSYFGNFSYLPLYFQTILRYSPLVSGALILAVIIPTSLASHLSGQYISRVGSYMHCILVGFILRATGNGLTLLFHRGTGPGLLIPVLVIEGLGIGFSLQPILMGMYANNKSEDRGATTGLRNYIRTIGGASGLVVSGAILSNILSADLYGTGIISKDSITALTSSTYLLDQTDLPQNEKDIILDVYMKGIHYIFIYHTVCSGLCMMLTMWVGNTGMIPAKVSGHTEANNVRDAENEANNDFEMQKLLLQLRNGRVT